MYVGLKNIQRLFSKYETLLTRSDGIHSLTGWNKLAAAPADRTMHVLYTCEGTDLLESIDPQEDIHILCIVKTGTDLSAIAAAIPEHISLLLLAHDDANEIYSKLQDYYNIQCGVSMYGQSLLEFLAFEDGLQSAIEYSFRIFRNPIFVFDTNYNLIAATWEAIDKLGIQDDVIVNKHFTSQEFKMVSRENNIHSKVLKSEIPIRSFNTELGYEQMYCAINTQKNLGHIVISAINKPFEPIDSEFMLILKKYIDQQMKKDIFIRSARGFNYEYFLRDLLDEKIAANMSSAGSMRFTSSEFAGNLFCLVIETARSPETINAMQIRNILESRFPNVKTLIYNGQIIAIISIPHQKIMPEEYISSARKICIDNDLFAGLSNAFTNIMAFKEYYLQALRAIELGDHGSNCPGLFVYADYFLEHVTNNFRQKESAETFCHPKMRILLDYDAGHNSELAYTLYMYLVHERNLAAASNAMDMHRTSLVYRFKKIHSLIGEEFEDYRERLYLILSYEMNKDSCV